MATIDEHEFAQAKKEIIEELNTLSNSLFEVAERYYSSFEDKLLNPKDKSYSELVPSITKKSLQNFANRFFVRESRRVTIELFAKSISSDEKTFKLSPSFSLNQRQYTVVTIDEITERKSSR